jgi:replication factor C subunit 3/5
MNKPKENTNKKNSPWIEKYRPSQFHQIVLEPTNRTIFENILKKRKFPHMLFYGPPGVGKTTTANNLIKEYQTVFYHRPNSETVIHLNASDERGIDLIRSQIHQFVETNNMFEEGLKFVVLDEVDYMTKNAQQALKNILQSYSNNVRFCLICNYICKIDESLKNEFICVRFNQLPRQEIFRFIRSILQQEQLTITDETIYAIQNMYHSDIRSMINFIQLHQYDINMHDFLMVDSLFEELHHFILDKCREKGDTDLSKILNWVYNKSNKCNLDIKTIINQYFNYMIRIHKKYILPPFLNIAETILHNGDMNNSIFLNYFIYQIHAYYQTIE